MLCPPQPFNNASSWSLSALASSSVYFGLVAQSVEFGAGDLAFEKPTVSLFICTAVHTDDGLLNHSLFRLHHSYTLIHWGLLLW